MIDIIPYRKVSADSQPNYLHGPYKSTLLRAPTLSPVEIPQTLSEVTGPQFYVPNTFPGAHDLTRQHGGQPLGERILIQGRVLEEDGRPVPHTLVEIWQANAAGRYLHKLDQHNAPIDQNFSGEGHTFTDELGQYRFVTIRPGAYPWSNHHNAWRPAHIHFSVFGPAFATRLVTQMYFPGDPLLSSDPIFNCIADECVRDRLIAIFDWDTTVPLEALGFRFDIVLRGRGLTPFETSHRR